MIPESDRLARMLLGRLVVFRRTMWLAYLRDKTTFTDKEKIMVSRTIHETSKYAYYRASERYRRNSSMPKYSQERA